MVTVRKSGRPADTPSGPSKPVWGSERTAGWVIGLATVASVGMFAYTGSWLWFLAIPIVTALVYGMGGSHDAR